MSVLNSMRRLVQKLGVDVQRYPHADPLFQVAFLLRTRSIEYVIDVGANEGQYTSSLRRLGYGRFIVSIEPLKAAAAVLERAAARDALWMIERTAIGATEGEAVLHVAGNSVSSSIAEMLERHRSAAPQSAYVGAEVVPVMTLDAIVAKHRPPLARTFVKIDTQGFERQVLEGAGETLASVAGIQIELSLVPLYEGQLGFDEGCDLLRDLGFVLVAVLPGFTDHATGETLQCDGVFFRAT